GAAARSQALAPASGSSAARNAQRRRRRSKAAPLGRGAADRQPVHAQRWLADPDRHALAVLAAGADAIVEPQIVADHRDLGDRVGAVADQRRTLDRRADLAVLDEVGLGRREDEFPGGDVDAAAAKIERVKPALDR